MAGSIRKITLDGQTFNVAGDSNFSQNPGEEKEGIVHTGGVTIKTSKMVATVEGVDIICTAQEYLDLQEASAKGDIPMSYEESTGDVWRAVGQINLGARETETDKCSLTLIPKSKWEPFLVG